MPEMVKMDSRLGRKARRVVEFVVGFDCSRLKVDLKSQRRDPHFQMLLARKYDVEAAA